MANSILSSLTSKAALKITDWKTKAVRWPKLNVATVEIGAASSNADVPISTNQIAADSTTYKELQLGDLLSSKIINPTRIRITGFVEDQSTLDSIVNIFNDVTSMLSITSKSIITDSMVMVNVDIEQTPEMISAVKITIEFEQATPPTAGDFNPEESGDENAHGLRIQSPPTLSESVNSLYDKVSKLF